MPQEARQYGAFIFNTHTKAIASQKNRPRMFKKLLTLVAALTRICVFALMCAGASTIARAQTKITYFHNDLAGSPVAASDSTGTIIWRESYRPYGEKLRNETAGQSNSQWYTGHRQDAESGLVYMGARHYDPLIGRFLSIDPVGFSEGNPHSFNRYAYANNNPVKFVDPDGRFALQWAIPAFLITAYVVAQIPPEKREELALQAQSELRRLLNPKISHSPGPVISKSEGQDKGSGADTEDQQKAKPDREQRPYDVPTGTKPIDQDKRLDRQKIHDIKRQLGAQPKDWVGVDRDGNIWTNEAGSGTNQGHYQDFLNEKKGG
jgi:RHS repeat-associated protein